MKKFVFQLFISLMSDGLIFNIAENECFSISYVKYIGTRVFIWKKNNVLLCAW